jgi:hypothetical protein
VRCAFISTLLSHGLDKRIVSHFILIFISNLFFQGQIKRLTGYTANPRFLSQITVSILISHQTLFLSLYWNIQWLTYHHSPLIEKIETVRAFHFGTAFLVEVHIVLPETMLVGEAHDIAEGLQQKIERLPEIERVNNRIFFILICFIHSLDIRSHRS